MASTDLFLDSERFEAVRRLRATDPAAVAVAHLERPRRSLLSDDGRLFLIAADHPARGALGVGDEPTAMADRYRMLDRLALALSRPGVDGVLGTPDVIDDLVLLGALACKVVAGSMNRGGLRGAIFEMDDRYTAYDVDGIVRDRLDLAKCLVRINLRDAATVATLDATAAAVTAAAAANVPIMLEPFMSAWRDGAIEHDLSADAVITSVGIASALGASSAYTWMKLPVVPEMERVMASTTLPTLLLGGDRSDDPDAAYAAWERALALPGVRGLVVGRNLLYPPDGDVAAAVDVAARLVRPELGPV